MKIYVVGPAGSGKSVAARLLAARRKLRRDVKVSECGAVLLRRLARIFAKLPWAAARDVDGWVAFMTERKEEYRAALREYGDQITAENPTALIDASADMIVGVRRFAEVCGIYRNGSWMVDSVKGAQCLPPLGCRDIWIYVDRPGVGLASDSFDRAFFEKFCTHRIQNDSDLENLENETARIAEICQ